ncbi:MAG: 30S ribosome-binding factor RbfA [Desulfuromonadales bacterium]|nr:30S ribosome-binding factor RbfA [Desulfuromonadales bacterium]MDZ4184639.1 30S ribosome-binding factor RbfA [Desulfuromonadales bacterium]
MGIQRAQKVAEAIQKEISSLIIKGLKDPRVGFVTITAVDVTSDLSLAKVFFTVIGDDKARKDSAAGLKSAIPYIRREIGKQLRLRVVPEVVFHYDTSIDYGHHIEALLKGIQEKEDDGRGDSQDN